MTCASCAATVEKTLQGQRGVRAASVNYANASAQLELETTTTNLNQLKNAVHAAGYELIVDENITPADLEAMQIKAYRRLLLNTTLSIAISLPLVIIAMSGMALHIPYQNFIMWALATPVLAIFGRQFFIGAAKQAAHGKANMDTLVALSTGIAYIFSAFNTLAPRYFAVDSMDAPVYFESAAVVISFILLGKLLEDRAKSTTSSAIKKLMGLQPDFVIRIGLKDKEEQVPLKEVIVGDVLLVKPGDKIPVDGVVTLGESFVNESSITGEPLAVEKSEGKKVFAGTVNQKGSFRFRAEKVGSDTLLAQIIKKVQEAQGSKAPIQKMADKVAGVFVPIVIVIALITLGVWMYFGGSHGLAHGVLSMITVLVVACPCALGLATPTAIIAGVGKGAENGMLIKDAESLETIQKINTIVFDKTGTLTEGLPAVVDIAWKDGADTATLSGIIYGMERLSEHPLADAITSFFQSLDIAPTDVKSFSSIPGSGVTAVYASNIYFAGNLKLLQSMNIALPAELTTKAATWASQANSVVWLANQYTAVCAIAISDKIKIAANAVVGHLKELGIESHMLTGDNEETAYVMAEEAGITQYKAEATPNDKAEYIKQLQRDGKIVAMVGDGINDSQALAQADMSIAMGTGTDIAMDIAKMTLISGDLEQISKAIQLSRRTVATIRQNLFWAFIYNIVALPLAAGALYPLNGFLINPMIAGAAMALSSVSVVTNSLRLKWRRM